MRSDIDDPDLNVHIVLCAYVRLPTAVDLVRKEVSNYPLACYYTTNVNGNTELFLRIISFGEVHGLYNSRKFPCISRG